MAVDFHVHSNASDGTVTPSEIPRLAAEGGLKAVALTDHDTVAGLPDFLAQQDLFPELELIAGVEISCQWSNREIHLTGLFIDPENADLKAFLHQMADDRKQRSELMLEKLRYLGYELSPDDLKAAGAPDDVPGRPHFARALMDKYKFSCQVEVFDRLLKRGAPGYVPRKHPMPEMGVGVIKKAGGVAVWAHPVSRAGGEEGFARRLLSRLVPAGLDAMEAYYTDFLPRQTEIVLKLAAEYRLKLSGGSDFHGDNHPGVYLGVGRGNLMVPDELLEGLKNARRPKVLLV